MVSKTRGKHSKYLTFLGRNASTNVKDKVNNIIKLYDDGKISQLQTAENILLKLISRDGRVQTSGVKQYDKYIEKFQKQAPLKERLKATALNNIKKKIVYQRLRIF